MRFLFVDFNAYFASVEQHDEPALRGRPVVVTPLDSEHSGAIAASYEAKALGISRGTSIREAREICPDIAVRPARHDRYVIVHHALMEEIERHLPIQRICSIDECVCRLSASESGIAAARAKADEIKRGIYANVGEALRCSIGVASSALLAKLASELEKPDGFTAIATETLPEALADLPLQAIPGVGPGIARRLSAAGVTNFIQLWELQPKHARSIWNSVNGEKFIYALKGHDVPDLAEPKKAMIGHSRVLSGDHRSADKARIVARALMLKAASRLRHCGLYAGAMVLSVRLYPEGGRSLERVFRATRNSWRLLDILDELWSASVLPLGPMRPYGPRSLKLVTVYLQRLQERPPDGDLFVSAALDRRDDREAELWMRIDALNRRYGMHKVFLASQAGLDLNYLGVKIAFSRVPELSEFADGNSVVESRLAEKRQRALRKNAARSLY